MNPEQLEKILQSAGRQTAQNLLESAVNSADSVEELENQLAVCVAAAIHILATTQFNIEKQVGENNDFESELLQQLRAEVGHIKNSGDMVLVRLGADA